MRELEGGRASWLYRSRQHAKLRRRNVYMCSTEGRGKRGDGGAAQRGMMYREFQLIRRVVEPLTDNDKYD